MELGHEFGYKVGYGFTVASLEVKRSQIWPLKHFPVARPEGFEPRTLGLEFDSLGSAACCFMSSLQVEGPFRSC
jgi:hypothetical protein